MPHPKEDVKAKVSINSYKQINQIIVIYFFLCALTTLCVDANTIRVVSQTVGSDEMLLALASPDQIAALSPLAKNPVFCARSNQASPYPIISANGDAESILKFNPTLVLCADFTRPELISQLKKSKVKVIIFDHYSTIDEAYVNLRTLAKELNEEKKAEMLINESRRRINCLKTLLVKSPVVKVLMPSTFGVLAGKDTTFQDLCEHTGADNVASSYGHIVGFQKQPSEAMISWPIDYIILEGSDYNQALATIQGLPPYSVMQAVKQNRVVLIPGWIAGCISIDRVKGYEILAKALHPELF